MYCSPRHRMPLNSRNKKLNSLINVAVNICQVSPRMARRAAALTPGMSNPSEVPNAAASAG